MFSIIICITLLACWYFWSNIEFIVLFSFFSGAALFFFYHKIEVFLINTFIIRPLSEPVVEGGYFHRHRLEKQIIDGIKASNNLDVYIEGPSGSGKSTLARRLAFELSKTEKVLFYVATIDCFEFDLLSHLVGDTVASILKDMMERNVCKESKLKYWMNVLLSIVEKDHGKPIYVFIDQIDRLVNEGVNNESQLNILQQIFEFSKERNKGKIVFVFIASSHATKLLYRTKRQIHYVVRETTKEEAIDYLSLRGLDQLKSKQLVELYGTLMRDLVILANYQHRDNDEWLREYLYSSCENIFTRASGKRPTTVPKGFISRFHSASIEQNNEIEYLLFGRGLYSALHYDS
ncbi:hypothetical protein ABK040_003433 [Willaertia magna]